MMTLDEKIGQMIMIGFRGTTIDNNVPVLEAIKKYKVGGVWLTDDKSPMGETVGNIQSAGQVKKLIAEMQAISDIPLFVSIDAEGGKVIRLHEEYGFPGTKSAAELYAHGGITAVKQNASQIAETISELGFNFNFAPVADLALEKENIPLVKKERCFSADPDEVTEYAEVVIDEHCKKQVLTLLKHFPGHGSSKQDTHQELVDVTKTWQDFELKPYQELIPKNKVDAVLTAHIVNRNLDEGFPATLSKKIVGGMLRGKLGFEGLVISDDLNMGAIVKNYRYDEALRLCIEAGVDIMLNANVLEYNEKICEVTFNTIKEMVLNGIISEARIDESVNRVMKLKNKWMINGI